MQNDNGEVVDIYIPRKCSATNALIGAKDHASIQIRVAGVDEDSGLATSETTSFAICGAVRAMGEADDSLNRLAEEAGILKGVYEKN
eukprot:m.351322 g.351322  ORF g.351322 m.351322 type:complete len:87 (+) comp16222_c0_seq1:385-645(+)